MKTKTLFEIGLLEHRAEDVKQRELIRCATRKRLAAEAQLKRAIEAIPGVIETLKQEAKFAKYFQRAKKLPGFGSIKLAQFLKKRDPNAHSAFELSEYSFLTRRFSRILGREIEKEIFYFIALVNNCGQMKVGVYEHVYRSHAYEWVERDPGEFAAIRKMLLKLSSPRTALKVLFAHRPPK